MSSPPVALVRDSQTDISRLRTAGAIAYKNLVPRSVIETELRSYEDRFLPKVRGETGMGGGI